MQASHDMWDVQDCDQVVAQIKNSKILETPQIFNLLNSVIIQIEDV